MAVGGGDAGVVAEAIERLLDPANAAAARDAIAARRPRLAWDAGGEALLTAVGAPPRERGARTLARLGAARYYAAMASRPRPSRGP